jgi:endonuclease/exonuclease/phosphatase family metal-dependent hydrolase
MALGATAAEAKPTTVKVMSRNIYLGADLTEGVRSNSLQGLVNAAGVILNQVDQNDFGKRAVGLAAEVQKNKPDLIGLQEGALWRTEPCNQNPLEKKANTVRWDFVKLLLAQINKGKTKYRLVISKPEFDFEVWANTDGNEATAGEGCPMGSEINGRLTMRDAILAKAGVKTSQSKSGTFSTLLQVKPAGAIDVDVTRGWTRTTAQVGKGPKFTFVNSHFEAFDSDASNHTNKNTDVGNGQIREAQAKQMVAKGGPATGKLPVIFLGDFNSDVKTEIKPGDGLAYRALLKAGFVERSAVKPFGCCLNSSLITANGGGKTSDFDHKVDHVMTSSPKRIKLVSSSVPGRSPVNGFWPSDHAGLFSKLTLR